MYNWTLNKTKSGHIIIPPTSGSLKDQMEKLNCCEGSNKSQNDTKIASKNVNIGKPLSSLMDCFHLIDVNHSVWQIIGLDHLSKNIKKCQTNN